MKKRLVCIGLALALLAGLSLTAAAEDLELPAPSCILMEKQTGQVLYESNAHEKLRPASAQAQSFAEETTTDLSISVSGSCSFSSR